MTNWNRVAGDVNDTITAQLAGVETLTGVDTIVAHVKRTGTTAVTLPATVTDAATRTVTAELGAETGWLATVAEGVVYRVEWEATYIDGSKVTWPSRGTDTLTIRSQLA